MNSSGSVILGSQVPTYRTRPDGATSYAAGEDAIALANSAGIILDRGQEEFLLDAMAERHGKWLASEVVDVEPRQNGKGVNLEVRSLAGMYLLKEPLVVWTAHEFATAKEGFLRLRGYLDNYDHLRKRVKSIRVGNGELGVELLNGSRTRWLARTSGGGRGFAGVSPLFLDEAFALTPEQIGALVFAKSAAANPQVWNMSSAPLTGSAPLRDLMKRGRKGSSGLVYYEWSAKVEVSAAERLITRIKSAGSDHADPADIDQALSLAAEANRALGTRISPATVLSEIDSTPVEQFVRERLSVFSMLEEGGRINPAHWNDIEDPESRREGDVSLAVDISLGRDWYSIVLFGRRADDLGHVQLIRAGSDVSEIVPALVDAREVLDPVCFAMAAGTYAALKVRLKAEGFLRPEERPVDVAMRQIEGASVHPPQRGDLLILNGTDMGAATGGILQAVKGGTLRHVPSDQLTSAVRIGQTKVSGSQLVWVTSDEAVDITALVAMTEAKWAHEARVDEIEDYDPLADFL